MVRGSHGGEKAERLVAPKILAEVTANHPPQSERQDSRAEGTATSCATVARQGPRSRLRNRDRNRDKRLHCAALDETTSHASV